MRIKLLILIFLFSISCYTQNNTLNKKQIKKVAKYAELLSSEWEFVGFKGDVPDFEYKKFDYLPKDLYIVLTDSGYVERRYNNDKLIYDKKLDIGNLSLSFNNKGLGYWNEVELLPHLEIKKVETGYYEPHPPQPKIVYSNRKYFIHMNEMLSEYTLKFEVNKNKLKLTRLGNNYTSIYKRINKSTNQQ